MRQVSLWDVDDVDTFGPVSQMTVGSVEQIDVREFCRRWHYTGAGGSALWNYGLYDGEVLVGVVTYNLPTRRACASVFGEQHVDKVAHMGRLVCADDAPRNSESRLIALSLKSLAVDQPHLWAVLTFAAQDEGHIGYVYQATNAVYTGTGGYTKTYLRADGTQMSTNGKCGPDEIKRLLANGGRIVNALPKHRYVYILGTPAQRRERRKLLKLPSLPYPKAGIR